MNSELLFSGDDNRHLRHLFYTFERLSCKLFKSSVVNNLDDFKIELSKELDLLFDYPYPEVPVGDDGSTSGVIIIRQDIKNGKPVGKIITNKALDNEKIEKFVGYEKFYESPYLKKIIAQLKYSPNKEDRIGNICDCNRYMRDKNAIDIGQIVFPLYDKQHSIATIFHMTCVASRGNIEHCSYDINHKPDECFIYKIIRSCRRKNEDQKEPGGFSDHFIEMILEINDKAINFLPTQKAVVTKGNGKESKYTTFATTMDKLLKNLIEMSEFIIGKKIEPLQFFILEGKLLNTCFRYYDNIPLFQKELEHKLRIDVEEDKTERTKKMEKEYTEALELFENDGKEYETDERKGSRQFFRIKEEEYGGDVDDKYYKLFRSIIDCGKKDIIENGMQIFSILQQLQSKKGIVKQVFDKGIPQVRHNWSKSEDILKSRFLYEGEPLLSLEPSRFQKDLDQKRISEELRKKFENNRGHLPKHAKVSIKERGSIWEITDEIGDGDHVHLIRLYLIRRKNGRLEVYKEYPLFPFECFRFGFWRDVDTPDLIQIPITVNRKIIGSLAVLLKLSKSAPENRRILYSLVTLLEEFTPAIQDALYFDFIDDIQKIFTMAARGFGSSDEIDKLLKLISYNSILYEAFPNIVFKKNNNQLLDISEEDLDDFFGNTDIRKNVLLKSQKRFGPDIEKYKHGGKYKSGNLETRIYGGLEIYEVTQNNALSCNEWFKLNVEDSYHITFVDKERVKAEINHGYVESINNTVTNEEIRKEQPALGAFEKLVVGSIEKGMENIRLSKLAQQKAYRDIAQFTAHNAGNLAIALRAMEKESLSKRYVGAQRLSDFLDWLGAVSGLSQSVRAPAEYNLMSLVLREFFKAMDIYTIRFGEQKNVYGQCKILYSTKRTYPESPWCKTIYYSPPWLSPPIDNEMYISQFPIDKSTDSNLMNIEEIRKLFSEKERRKFQGDTVSIPDKAISLITEIFINTLKHSPEFNCNGSATMKKTEVEVNDEAKDGLKYCTIVVKNRIKKEKLQQSTGEESHTGHGREGIKFVSEEMGWIYGDSLQNPALREKDDDGNDVFVVKFRIPKA